MYRIILNALCRIGLEKLAVRIALRAHPTGPYGGDAWDILFKQTSYPACDYCYHPILTNTAHLECQQELGLMAEQAAEEEAAWLAYVAEEEDRMWREAEEDRIAAEEEEAWRRYEEEQQALHDDDDIDDMADPCPECWQAGCSGRHCDDCGAEETRYGCLNGCGEEDPLKGDVEPVGGYPEYTYRVPNGHGGFEEVHYDPNDPKTWPFDPFDGEEEDFEDEEDISTPTSR